MFHTHFFFINYGVQSIALLFRYPYNNVIYLFPVVVREDVTGVHSATGDWDVTPPVCQIMNTTASKLSKEMPHK